MNITVYLGSRCGNQPCYADYAYALGAWIAHHGHTLVYGGSRTGLMGELADGALQAGGQIMIVSQFTLFASTRRGNRPSYIRSAPEAVSRPIYERFVESVRTSFGGKVATGVFGADMKVELVNDGPVTIWIDSRNRE